jgi:TonB family protein
MNFDALLESRDNALKAQQSKLWLRRSIIGISLGVIIVPLAWLALRDERQNKPHEPQREQKSSSKPSLKSNTPPVQNPEPAQVQPISSEKKINSKTVAAPVVLDQQKDREDRDNAWSSYIQAEPVKGYAALYGYFNKELVYPPEVKRDSIVEGVVTVIFTINKEGRPEIIKIENSLGIAFDRESKRIIEEMPLWKPALLNGKPIDSKISIPLTFRADKLK